MEQLLSYRARLIVGFLSGLLFLLLLIFAIRQQSYIIWILPVVLLFLLVAITSVEKFYLLLLLLVPLSIQLRFIISNPPADLFLPTEPMLMVLLLILLFKIFNSREIHPALLRRPLSIVILLMLCWMLLTSLTSVSPLISLKALISRTWFIGGFYFISLQLFTSQKRVERSLKLLIAGLMPVIIYNFARLWRAGLFNQQAAHSTMWPFFNDHTSFGAAIAFIIPVTIYFVISGRKFLIRVLWALTLVILLAGVIFSYSRAAWLSMVVAFILALLLFLRIPWKVLLPAIFTLSVVVILSWSSIIGYLGDVRQDSSADILDHVRSAANITTDASNMERINRWKAAFRMIAEKPLLGWGPGNYQFNYAPYQLEKERTIISTNFGDRGNAHSEYIGAAVDSGIPGALLFLILIIMAIVTGIRYCIAQKDRNLRLFMIAVVSGLVTYAFHGFLNNFLDTDKISAPFWISIAIIVVLQKKIEEEKKESAQKSVAARIDTSSNI